MQKAQPEPELLGVLPRGKETRLEQTLHHYLHFHWRIEQEETTPDAAEEGAGHPGASPSYHLAGAEPKESR